MTTDSPIDSDTEADGGFDRYPSIDELDRSIRNLAAHINATTHDFLVLIRRFDERAGWLGWGFENCAAWLHWRCDISVNAAREKVRVAHAIKTLPAIAMAFAKGELSYSKVRALTRVAGGHNEEELLTFALRTTAARVEERCRELRWGTEASTDAAARAYARRNLSLRRNPERGTVTITVELPIETGELIDKALDRARETTASNNPEFAHESWAAQQADALVAMAQGYLKGTVAGSGEPPAGGGTADHYQVTVHVDEAALSRGEGRSGLPIESVRRIACDSDRVILVEDAQGEPLSIGRKTRVVSTAIKRALRARDKGCRFPGCRNERFVDAYHVRHWSAGGETGLANLILLCTKHHELVHEGGFTIAKDYRDRWFFKRPDGHAVPACGYRADDMTDDDVETGDEYFHSHTPAGVCATDYPSVDGCLADCASAEGCVADCASAEGYEVWLPRWTSQPPAEVLSTFEYPPPPLPIAGSRPLLSA